MLERAGCMMKAFVFLSVLAAIAGFACSASQHLDEVPVKRVDEVGGVECDICELIIKEAEQLFLQNSTEQEVKEALEEFCQELPLYQDTCKDIIDEYFDEIWNAIVNYETPEAVCTEIGLCSSKKSIEVSQKAPVKKVDKVGDVECDICEAIVKVVEMYALQNSTEEEVKEELEKFCQDLPESSQAICQDLIDQYFDQIWNDIINEETPEEVCTELGFCGSKKFIKVAPKAPVKKVDKVGGVECDLCEAIVKVVEMYALQNSTEEEVKEALEEFCESLPSGKETCEDIINQYFDQIWQAIVNEETPEEVCTQIELCGSKKFIKVNTPKQPLCDYCKLITSFLSLYIDENSTEDDIEKNLEVLCGLLPSEDKGECMSVVTEYFPMIYQLMKDDVDNNEICYQIGLCSNSVLVKEKPSVTNPPKSQSNVTCQICELVANAAKPFVDSEKDEKEVEDAINDVCKLIPNSNTSAECLQYVKEYFTVIWTLVKAEVDSGEICNILHLCTKGTHAQTVQIHFEKITKPEAGVLCVICEYVMKEIEAQLPINATEDEIMKLVLGICDSLPSTIQSECTDLINEYGKQIIDALINNVAPNAVCTVIHLCAVESVDTPMGGNKCSWGPAYWCSTPEAAIECNAKDYCNGQKLL